MQGKKKDRVALCFNLKNPKQFLLAWQGPQSILVVRMGWRDKPCIMVYCQIKPHRWSEKRSCSLKEEEAFLRCRGSAGPAVLCYFTLTSHFLFGTWCHNTPPSYPLSLSSSFIFLCTFIYFLRQGMLPIHAIEVLLPSGGPQEWILPGERRICGAAHVPNVLLAHLRFNQKWEPTVPFCIF